MKHKSPRYRSLHKRLLLHPISLWVLLVFGQLIIGLTLVGSADSYTLNAVVPAPPLGEGANIVYPADDSIITNLPLTITGTCPSGSYVDLVRNSVFSGMANCDSSGSFTITTDLSIGTNTLQAQDYNITNSPGPITAARTVFYHPPPVPLNGGNTGPVPSSGNISHFVTYQGSNAPSKVVRPTYDDSGNGPLMLSSSYDFQTTILGQQLNLPLGLSGGTGPYYVSVDWGDSDRSSLTFDNALNFSTGHIYKKAGSYNIMVSVVDSEGVKVVLQLAVRVKPIALISRTVTPSSSAPLPSRVITSGKHWLEVIWPVYGITVLMAASFWLGERGQYKHLLKNHRLKTR